MKYRISHNTTYTYATPAEACHNALRLTPRTTAAQSCDQVSLRIEPPPAQVHTHVDFFGNQVHHFVVLQPHERLSITSEVEVTVGEPGSLPENSPAWNEVARRLRVDRDDPMIDALVYAYDSPYVRMSSGLREYAAQSFTPRRPLIEAAEHLTERIHADFTYDPEATTIDTSTEIVLKRRRGVCQDFAHFQIGCLRALGLSARYVSGYLRTEARPGHERLVGVDASHAWLSVFCPSIGWVDFDPTNGCRTSDSHITVAWGRDYHDVSPVRGIVLGATDSAMKVAVDVEETS